ncbi:YdcF family protein, partial [Wohlfahrtiimonas larvae]
MTNHQEQSKQSFALFCLHNFRFGISLFVLLCLIIIGVGNGIIHSQVKEMHAADSADAIIVLGYQIEGEPLEPSKALKNRLDMAYQYWLESPKVKVIVSGGKTQGYAKSEAEVMQEYLVKRGIPSENILLEDDSTRTAHQFINSKKLMNIHNAVVVTNDFHLPRSLMLAARSGIEHVSGLAAATPTDTRSIFVAYIREPFA